MYLFKLTAYSFTMIFLSGCAVYQIYPAQSSHYYSTSDFKPSYPIPAPGYVWINHPQHGYGWHHQSYGWHKGWH
jgi:hypothetical protein